MSKTLRCELCKGWCSTGSVATSREADGTPITGRCARCCERRGMPDGILRDSPRILTGGRWKDRYGYIILRCSGEPKTISEHRLVMEQMIGRPLTKSEAVHHKNHDRSDNRPENLELMSVGSHIALHNSLQPKRKKGVAA